jgi:DNA primase
MDAKEEVKDRLSVEEVVGDYVELKRAGRNLKAISPFTNEKTASLMVSPDKQIWHDFSSSKGGDIFTFVMEMEGIDFRAALEILARRAGVELEQYQGSGVAGKQKERLFEATELAMNYYHATLAKNRTALEYVVKKRGFNKQTIQDFKIGFAPHSGHALTDFLKKRGFTADEMVKAGLATNRRGLYDLFRGRILIPLSDGQGRPVGFTGRIMVADENGPKYLNTPATMIYDKGRQVFGLHMAKDAIRKQDFTILTEGNLDVVSSHQAGVKNVVASAGTALTKQQLLSLSRLSDDVRLSFDADDAGLAATERAIPIAQEVGVKLSIIELPKGQDPDDIIRENPETWQNLVTKPVYVVDWVLHTYEKRLDITTSQGKRALSDKALEVIARLQDPIEREHYVREIAQKLNVRVDTVQTKLDQIMGKIPPKKRNKVSPISKDEIKKLTVNAFQDQLLGLNLMYSDVRTSLRDIESFNFEGDIRQKVAEYILASSKQGETNVPKELLEVGDYVKIIMLKTEELYGDWSSTDRTIEAIGLAQRLKRNTTQKRKELLSESIKRAEAVGNDSQVQELLEQFHELLKE